MDNVPNHRLCHNRPETSPWHQRMVQERRDDLTKFVALFMSTFEWHILMNQVPMQSHIRSEFTMRFPVTSIVITYKGGAKENGA